MSIRVLVTAWALLATGCRFGFDPLQTTGDGGILPPGDGRLNGDAPDSAALFDCKMTHPSALFCDGFEGPMGESWDYEIVMNGRAESTTTRSYRGGRAFETETFDIDDYKGARWGTFFPSAIDSGELHIRGFYWMDSSTVFGEQASILSTGNNVDPYPSTYVMFTPTELHLQVDGDVFTFPGQGFPRDRWVCMEIHINVDPALGDVALELDGVNAVSVTNVDTYVGATGYTGVDIGVHYATPGQGPIRFWADEIIADTSPIGCN